MKTLNSSPVIALVKALAAVGTPEMDSITVSHADPVKMNAKQAATDAALKEHMPGFAQPVRSVISARTRLAQMVVMQKPVLVQQRTVFLTVTENNAVMTAAGDPVEPVMLEVAVTQADSASRDANQAATENSVVMTAAEGPAAAALPALRV